VLVCFFPPTVPRIKTRDPVVHEEIQKVPPLPFAVLDNWVHARQPDGRWLYPLFKEIYKALVSSFLFPVYSGATGAQPI
jgi:hypothetical protein